MKPKIQHTQASIHKNNQKILDQHFYYNMLICSNLSLHMMFLINFQILIFQISLKFYFNNF